MKPFIIYTYYLFTTERKTNNNSAYRNHKPFCWKIISFNFRELYKPKMKIVLNICWLQKANVLIKFYMKLKTNVELNREGSFQFFLYYNTILYLIYWNQIFTHRIFFQRNEAKKKLISQILINLCKVVSQLNEISKFPVN